MDIFKTLQAASSGQRNIPFTLPLHYRMIGKCSGVELAAGSHA
jgi:hypothetical protein